MGGFIAFGLWERRHRRVMHENPPGSVSLEGYDDLV
jgi:hypothetical protein